MNAYNKIVSSVIYFFANTIKKKEFLFFVLKICLVFVFFTATYFSYIFFKNSHDVQASLVYCEIIERYQKAVEKKSPTVLTEIIEDCEIAAKKYWLSSFKYFFGLCRCCSLALLNDEKAIEEMSLIVEKLPRNTELYRISLVSLALMMIDKSNNDVIVNKGKRIFDELIKNSKESFADTAIFYHGLYEFKKGNQKEAGLIWKDLLYNPLYSESPFKKMVNDALNWEF
jgi:hypothetical protein